MSAKKNTSLDALLVELPVSFHDALEAINANAMGIIFFLGVDRKLVGVFTDGDVRRALLAGATTSSIINIDSDLYNGTPHYLPFDCDISAIWELFEKNIRCIPLVDESHRVVDFSTPSRVRRISVLEPDIGTQEISNVLECVASGWISSQGRFIPEFEKVFSQYLGGGHAIAVANGTVALQLGLSAMGVGYGDEVIVPNFTFGASINAIIHCGATPVLVDVDLETWTLDINELRKSITCHTKAIMPVHIYGQPARMDEIKDIALEYGILIIEDCAESLGAAYKGRRVGLDGDCSCFSFFANKTITTGEGGMVIFKDSKTAEKARILRDHGMNPKKRYWHEYAGFNFRMTNMQAAIGVAQMARIDVFLNRKKLIFQTYNRLLSHQCNISFLPNNNWSENSYWLYTIVLKDYGSSARDRLIVKLANRGIDARPGFYPMHEMNPYRRFGRGTYPVSNYLSANSISLPSSSGLSDREVEHIAGVFLDEISHLSKMEAL